jgi:hypothetical protein
MSIMSIKIRDSYKATSHRIRKEVLSLSVREEESLDDAGDGLAVTYELFYVNHPELATGDAYAGLEEMMRQWPAPWKSHALFHSALPLH